MPDQKTPQTFTYADRPELTETFADSLSTVVWDSQTLRVEFCVTRYPALEGANPGGQASRHPTCRMVLTTGAAADLYNRLKQTMEALAQAGVVHGQVAPQQQQLPPSGNA